MERPLTLSWIAHPAKQRPQDAALAAMIVLLTAYALLVSFASALLAVIGVAILVVAIAPFWAPTSYILDATGVRVRRLLVTRARPWTELRRLEVGARAAFVSPYRERRFLDRYRGILVLLPVGDQRAWALETLRERVVVPPA